VLNTASIKRLNTTFREQLAPLARRCRVLARQTLTLRHGMYLNGTGDNFCTRHESLYNDYSASRDACLSYISPNYTSHFVPYCLTMLSF
jgi:hypothetical protein